MGTNALTDKLDKYKMVNVFSGKRGQLSYLDYVFDGIKEKSHSDSYTATGKLVCEKIDIETQELIVKLNEDEDAVDKSVDIILRQVLDLIYARAATFGQHGNVIIAENLVLDKLIAESEKRRLITSRILNAANLVAVNCRRGPATFVLMSQKMYDFLNASAPAYQAVVGFPTNAVAMIAGMSVVLTEHFGNDTIVVGRVKRKDEPGIYVMADDITVEDYVMNLDQIEAFKLRYVIGQTPGVPPYVRFKVLEEEDLPF